MYYYIDRRNQQCGPVPASMLINYGVTLESYVWKAGMQNWAKAKTIPELQSILGGTSQQQRANFPQCSYSYYAQSSSHYSTTNTQPKRQTNGFVANFAKQYLRRIVMGVCAAGSAYCLSMWAMHDLNASHAEYAVGGIALAIFGFVYYRFERSILRFLRLD